MRSKKVYWNTVDAMKENLPQFIAMLVPKENVNVKNSSKETSVKTNKVSALKSLYPL